MSKFKIIDKRHDPRRFPYFYEHSKRTIKETLELDDLLTAYGVSWSLRDLLVNSRGRGDIEERELPND